MRKPEVVLEGLDTPEGPTRLSDGRIAFVQQRLGCISLVTDRGFEHLSKGAGSPNSVVAGSDGYLYVAQNGGVVGSWRSSEPTTPGVERVDFDGGITLVVAEVAGLPLGAPNDLTFGKDGRLYVTDPGEGYAPGSGMAKNRIVAIDVKNPGRSTVVIERPPSYFNGIAFLVGGELCWAESYTRAICTLVEGVRKVLVTLPEEHTPDGIEVASDGRLFVATVESHGVTVLSPDGSILDHLFLDETALPTNCMLDGSDLWVTDFGIDHEKDLTAGRLWRLETDAVAR